MPIHFLVRPTGNGSGFVAYGREEPFPDDFNPILTVGELWFAFGRTADEALADLKREHWN